MTQPVDDPPKPLDIATDPPPVAEADRCNVVGPKGFGCRLKKGHTPADLHAAHGETWTTSYDGDGWTPPSAREVPRGDSQDERIFALIERSVSASERQADALEGIRTSVEHYVEESFHKVRGS